jgi:pSer/pThr/pTyr-binding forkhead associated (FHA) protein
MKNLSTESHMLVIYDQPEPRRILLQSATYSIGRDQRNSIVIPHNSISRQHALLLRMPTAEQGRYCYRILDGNSAGKPSLNGLSVNGKECSIHDLSVGDIILVGNLIRIDYQILKVPNSEKYSEYLKIHVPQHQSIRAQPISRKATITAESQIDVAQAEEPILENWENDDDFMPTELFSK